MEDKLNIRKEVEEAREKASRIELHGHPEEIDAYWDIVCGTVLQAEEDLKEQDHEWEIASLAREMLQYAEPLEDYDHMLDQLYQASKRMSAALSDHPRLKVRLLKFEKRVLQHIEAMQEHTIEPIEDLTEEMEFLERNIALADTGRLDGIEQNGYLKRDSIEWTARWEEVIDEADRIVYQQLKDAPRGMGFCHAFWSTRTAVLKKEFGIDWRSPRSMNPRVMFD